MVPPDPDDEPTRSLGGPATESRRQRVVVVLPEGINTYVLRPGVAMTIGRARECDIRIDHPSVSRRHAVIHPGPPIFVEDLGSSNGTRLSGRRLSIRKPELVARGALVEVGIATVVVEGSEPFAPGAGEVADFQPPPDPRVEGDESYQPTMARVHRLVDLVAPGRLSILLLGETGVGKEVLAERIHARSGRAGGALVRIHCAALPEPLLESELFGHERGAFTGAASAKPGLLETAHGGTLLLDEVGELPLVTQAKLLRVLETREVLRLGAVKAQRIDVRFIAATHRDVDALAETGAFRSDLYYRLNGITIRIPPLRERTAEIAALVHTFVAEACHQMGWAPAPVTPAALALLEAHAWPGNIRELRNVVDRAVMLAAGGPLDVAHFPLSSRSVGPPSVRSLAPSAPVAPPPPPESVPLEAERPSARDLRGELADVERRRIVEALEQSGGNQGRAAELLGISRRTLLGRLDLYNLPRPRKKATDDA